MKSDSNTSRRTLDSAHWQLIEIPRSGIPKHNLLPAIPATVPGNVHVDLERAGIIPNPFCGLFERDVAWVDDSDWVYETTFEATEQEVADMAVLLFHGLDTIAEIELNGKMVGETDNMFIEHEIPVSGTLVTGSNTLRVTFRSARRIGRDRLDVWNKGEDAVGEHWDLWSSRSFVRKAQYMYGWDWGPVLLSAGIWKPVELVTTPVARILDYHCSSTLSDDDSSTVTVKATILCVSGEPSGLNIVGKISGHGEELLSRSTVEANGQVSVTAVVKRPLLWHPNGVGEPNLYDLALSVVDSRGYVLDKLQTKIGLRTVELIRDPDPEGPGESFKFRINGRDIFAKGANWIPDHSFPGTISYDQLHDRITQAHEAGLNMLRVWGGGLYESEDFYNICDELGIMVWQDFAYGCAYYPDTGDYAVSAREEAVHAIRRIRNHPSLVLWCGNNENYTMYSVNWENIRPRRYLGEQIYHDILPSVLKVENPEVPYWPSSPYSGDLDGDPDSQQRGDCHNWDVWHGRGDWRFYTENDTRFCSEFGFAASCGLAAWDTVLVDGADHGPYSNIVRWHDKTRKGYDVYTGYIQLHYPALESLEDLVYYSQANQADALSFGVEHYRRRMGHCWGTLFWQFNDCWPVQSWAVVDSLGEPRGAYYAAKRFYSPLLLSLVWTGTVLEAHLVSDFMEPLQGTLTIALRDFAGHTLEEKLIDATAGPNQAVVAARQFFDLSPYDSQSVYFAAVFTPFKGKHQRVNSLLIVGEPKDLKLPEPNLKLSVEQNNAAGEVLITVTSENFAPYVWLHLPGNESSFRGAIPLLAADNFFHLEAKLAKTITAKLPEGLTIDQFSARISARSMRTLVSGAEVTLRT